MDGFALPVKKLKGTDPVETLDLSGKNLGVASAVVIASLISVNGGLTATNLLGNQLDAESAHMLAAVAKQKGISLCGIRRDQTTADYKFLKPPDAILLASDLSQAVVTGALTSIDLSRNDLTHYGRDMTGIKELAAALGVNGAHDRHEVRKKHATFDADLSLLQVEVRDGVVAHHLHRYAANLARAGAGDSCKQ